jgi:conflict system pore-forming effector with SLATT domain
MFSPHLTPPASVLADWQKRIEANEQAHYKYSQFLSSRYTTIGIIAVVLSAVVGSSLFLGVESGVVKFGQGVLSIVVAILAGLQTFLRLSERAEKHRSIAAQLGSIRRDIDITESDDKAAIAKIKERLERIDAPIIPGSVWQRIEKAVATVGYKVITLGPKSH